MAVDYPAFDEVAQLVPSLLAIVDRSTDRVIDVNDHGLRLLGFERSELVGRRLSEILHLADQGPGPVGYGVEGAQVMVERRLRRSDGTYVNFSLSGREFPGYERLVLFSGHPIDELTHSDSSLGDLVQLAELTGDPFLVCDKQGYVRYANGAAQRLHNSRSIGAHITDFIHASDTGYVKLLDAFHNDDHRASARVAAVDSDGTPLILSVQTVYDPESEKWFSVERDITELVEQEERLAKLTAELRRRAWTDDLTGVANRSALKEKMSAALKAAESFCLLLLDMDDFKSVNDTLGHAAGDELLIVVAQRLRNVVASNGMVGRLGGDEFVLFVPGIDESVGASIASRVIESIGSPFSISGVTLSRSCSIGVALSAPGDTVSAVLKRADQAAYEAKHAGRSRFQVYGGASMGWPHASEQSSAIPAQ